MIDLYEEYLKHYNISAEHIENHKHACEFDPALLTESEKFVDELWARKDKRILVRSDYDVDGVDSGIEIYNILKELGFNVELTYPITKTGYGLTKPELTRLMQLYSPFDVIVTADCGIANQETIAFAKMLNIEVLVSDHHPGQANNHPIDAVAVVNPNRGDVKDGSPFHSICGTYVAHKLMKLLCRKYAPEKLQLVEAYEPLVVIATVGDMMPLTDENAYMLRKYQYFTRKNVASLRHISNSPQFQAYLNGLEAILSEIDSLTSKPIGWTLAPFMNSPRRVLGDAKPSFELFMQPTLAAAMAKFTKLKELNDERKQMLEDLLQVTPLTDTVVIIDNPKYEGLVGLVSSRLVQSTKLPSITFSVEGDICRGSSRAPAGYDLRELFRELKSRVPDGVISFGGHAGAAGITIKTIFADKIKLEWANIVTNAVRHEIVEQLPAFDITDLLKNKKITDSDIMIGLAEIDELYPFNRFIPQLRVSFEVDPTSRNVSTFSYDKHLRVVLLPSLDGIVFNYYKNPKKDKFILSGAIEPNTYGGRTRYQVVTFFN